MDSVRIASGTDPVTSAQAKQLVARAEARFGEKPAFKVLSQRAVPGTRLLDSLTTRLLTEEADAAVYPVDRLPSRLVTGLTVGAILEGPSFYRCLSTQRPSLSMLRGHARVFASDAIVRAQILHQYPRLEVETGPVSDDILDRLITGSLDAACVPPELSGSHLTPFELREQRIDPKELVPAIGLGLVAVIVRDELSETTDIIGEMNDEKRVDHLHLERSFLDQTTDTGDCIRTAWVTRAGDEIRMLGLMAQIDGRWLLLHEASGPVRLRKEVALEVARTCLDLANQRAMRSNEPVHAL